MAGKVLRRRQRRRGSLVHAHLEGGTHSLLEFHPEAVRNFIGRNAGIYALFRRYKLYYVGFAKPELRYAANNS